MDIHTIHSPTGHLIAAYTKEDVALEIQSALTAAYGAKYTSSKISVDELPASVAHGITTAKLYRMSIGPFKGLFGVKISEAVDGYVAFLIRNSNGTTKEVLCLESDLEPYQPFG